MLSKKHNDPFYWKNKLGALDCLPGAATEKDALWNKLHARLQQKPIARKAVWYWIAAGLLPVIIIALTMVNNTKTILVKNAVQNKKSTGIVPVLLPPVSNETVAFSVSAPVKEEATVNSIKSKIKNKQPAGIIQINEPVVAVSRVKTENETVVNNIQPADTVVSVATAAVAKNKLQVVHINELETFPAQFTAPVNYAQNIKPKKGKPNNISITASQNVIGFKIQLSSKN